MRNYSLIRFASFSFFFFGRVSFLSLLVVSAAYHAVCDSGFSCRVHMQADMRECRQNTPHSYNRLVACCSTSSSPLSRLQPHHLIKDVTQFAVLPDCIPSCTCSYTLDCTHNRCLPNLLRWSQENLQVSGSWCLQGNSFLSVHCLFTEILPKVCECVLGCYSSCCIQLTKHFWLVSVICPSVT